MPKDSKFYYNQISDNIKKSFTFEQKKAILSVLKTLTTTNYQVMSPKIININITFWFIKRFYFTIYLGRDRRARKRYVEYDAVEKIVYMSIYTIMFLATVFFILLLIFSVLYTFKCMLGIDLFPNFHLYQVKDIILNFIG